MGKNRTNTQFPSAPSLVDVISSGLSDEMKPLVITLAESTLAMQAKIIEKMPEFSDMELYQEVTVGTGETIMRGNPAMQEFRALVRDYSSLVSTLNSLLADKKPTSVSDLDSIRKKFKVAK